jgi:vanillate O-demethylase ferredoxin subunit
MRRWLLPLHRWTGLTAGLLLTAVALTGALMVFRVQLEPLVSPGLVSVPACAAPLPLDALVAAARAASPHGGALRTVRLYSDASARVGFSDKRWIFVDPCSGKVLGSEEVYGGPFGTLAKLHIFGYLPFSELLAGSLALLAACVMAAAGLLLWGPASRHQLRASWRLKPGLSGRARALNLHRTAALYAAPVLLACALSGLPQAFAWARSAIDFLSLSPPRPAIVTQTAVGQSAPLAPMWRQVQAMAPWPQKLQLHVPHTPGAPVVLEVVERGAPHPNAISYFYFDAASGVLLHHTPYAANPRGHRIYLWALALHYGWIGGVAGQMILLLGALLVPLLAWTGTASYLRGRANGAGTVPQQLLVARRTIEADGVCSFDLVCPQGGTLPRFTAGAHLEVRTPGGQARHYSLCNDPRDTRRYRIAVLRCEDSRGGSRSMHEALHEGGIIEASQPRNHFPIAPGARHSVLLAGGIGITPVLSMAEQLVADNASFELHYCCRGERHAAFRATLASPRFAGRVQFHYSEGPDRSRLDLDKLLARPAPGVHVYTCGPARFIDAVAAAAERHAWPAAQIHSERFGATSSTASDAGKPFDIRIASSGRIVHVPAGTTALAALTASGINVPWSCGQGVCGSCVTGVLQGEPEHRDQWLTPAERARNDRFAPCCSRARGDLLVLDL